MFWFVRMWIETRDMHVPRVLEIKAYYKVSDALTKNWDVVLDQESDFVIWNISKVVESLTEWSLHQTEAVNSKNPISNFQRSLSDKGHAINIKHHHNSKQIQN